MKLYKYSNHTLSGLLDEVASVATLQDLQETASAIGYTIVPLESKLAVVYQQFRSQKTLIAALEKQLYHLRKLNDFTNVLLDGDEVLEWIGERN
jgi:hypothetical protein